MCSSDLRKAFFLILRNILRISAVSIVSSFVLLIGKVLVPVGTTCVAYLALLTIQDRLTGIWAPLFFTFVLSFFTVEMFNEVFGMAIWTILQCFVADEEMFGEVSCAVCLSEFCEHQPLRQFACGHAFCAECADRWLQVRRVCPVCLRPT